MRNLGTHPQDDSSNDGTVDPLFVRRQRADPREHDQVSRRQFQPLPNAGVTHE